MAKQGKDGITYVDETWNPVRGCGPKMPCAPHCWARRMQIRHEGCKSLPHLHGFVDRATGEWTGKVSLIESELERPLHWTRPRRVAVGFMGDLFLLPWEEINHIMAVAAICYQHTFYVLTKQGRAMREYCVGAAGRVADRIIALRESRGDFGTTKPLGHLPPGAHWWPLSNVRLGISARNQPELEARAPWLIRAAADGWKTFLSLEPLLGPVSFRWAKWDDGSPNARRAKNAWPVYRDGRVQAGSVDHLDGLRMLADEVKVGGEAGPGARPMHPDWARAVRDECVEAGVPFEFKQWGEWSPTVRSNVLANVPGGDGTHHRMYRVGKRAAGRLLDGRAWNGEAE